MAAKSKTSTKSGGETNVTRITATDTSAKEKKSPAKVSQPPLSSEAANAAPLREKNPLKAIGRYFAGAWYELKQVRWPTRRATWGMTAAMLIFTAFFVLIILLLDALFKYLFELMLG